MILTDPYGKFVPGPARGLPQYVTESGLVEGDTAAPVTVPADTLHFDTPFLTDIAHNADPTPVDSDHNPATPPVAPRADDDHTASADFANQPAGTYDDELLDAHYIAGDGRANENIGLTTVHQIFHAEHNRLIADIERVLTSDGTALDQWQLPSGAWNGERLFQAARFVTRWSTSTWCSRSSPARSSRRSTRSSRSRSLRPTSTRRSTPSSRTPSTASATRCSTETIPRTEDDGSDDSMSLLDGFLNPRRVHRQRHAQPGAGRRRDRHGHVRTRSATSSTSS